MHWKRRANCATLDRSSKAVSGCLLPHDREGGDRRSEPGTLLQRLPFRLDKLLEWLLFDLHDDTPDGLKSWQTKTAYTEIKDVEYKAEQDLAEKYGSFVSEIMRLSLAAIGIFSFLITKSPTGIPVLGKCLAVAGILLLGASVFFAMRFLFGKAEGLRWYIAGLRYYKAQQSDDAQKALCRRGNIIEKCRRDKFVAALLLLLGAIFMAFASISAFLQV